VDVAMAEAGADGEAEEDDVSWRDEQHDDLVDKEGQKKLLVIRTYFVGATSTSLSPLGAAVFADSLDLLTVLTLLANGAPVEDGGSCGWQPLCLAVVREVPSIELVNVLIAAGADLQATPKGLTAHSPLLLAAMGRRLKVLAALLEAKANIEEYDSAGHPILANVAAWQHDVQSRRACALLLRHGAKVMERDREGQTAQKHALQARNELTAAYLGAHADSARQLALRELELLQDGGADGGGAARGGRKAKGTR